MNTVTRPTSTEIRISLPSAPKASPPAPHSTPDDSSSAAETPCAAVNLAAPSLVSTVKFTTVQNSDRELGPESRSSPRAEAKSQAAESSTSRTTSSVVVMNGVTSITGAELVPRSEPPYHAGAVTDDGAWTVSKAEPREEEESCGGVILRRKQASLVKPSSSLTPHSGAGMSGEAREHGASNSAKLM